MHLKRRRGNVPLWIGMAVILFLSYATYSQKSGLMQANFDQKIQTLDLGYSSPPTIGQLFRDLPQIVVNKFNDYPERPVLERVDIDIPLIEYKKILQDREKGLLENMLSDPHDVKGKIRYQGNVIKAKIRLKGDLPDHWTSQYRMSFRVSLKGNNSVMGFKKFSLHKPASRQHPFDQTFSKFIKASGNIGSTHSYIHVYVNGMEWGVMNIEEHMSKELLEKQRKKESLIVRFGSEEKGVLYNELAEENKYLMYRLAEPRLYLKAYDANSYLNDSLQRKRFTYIMQGRVKEEGSYLYDAESYGRALAIATVWNDAHPLYYSNSRHYFNPYSLRLEPIVSDAIKPVSILKWGRLLRRKLDPLVNSYLYRQVVLSKEYIDSIEQSLHQVIDSAQYVQTFLAETQDYFPLDAKIDKADILKENAKVVYQFKKQYFLPNLSETSANANLETPIQVFHRKNGVVEIFNNVPDRVDVLEFIVDGENIANLQLLLPSYEPNIAAPVILKTRLTGDLTGRFSVKARYQDKEYISVVSPTLDVLSYAVPAIPTVDFSHPRPSTTQAEVFSKHLHVRHFKDGRFELYNLLDDNVALEEIRLDGKIVRDTKIVVPGFVFPLFEPEIVSTDLTGILDGRISVKTSYKGQVREMQVSYSLDDDGIQNPILDYSRHKLPDYVESAGNGLWGIEGGVWDVKSPLVIDGNLMILAGTTLRFANNAYLLVKGGIYAEGTEQKPIILKPSQHDWRGLYVINGDAGSKFNHVKIEKTRALEDGILSLTGGVTFYRSRVVMDNVQFIGSNAEDALNIVESPFSLTNIKISDVRSDGIDFDFSEGDISHSVLTDVGGDALDFSGSTVRATNLVIKSIHDKAISAGEGTMLDISSIVIRDVGIGVASKDGSIVTGNKIVINDFHLKGVMSYQKKSFYNQPSVVLTNTIFSRQKNALSRQSGTSMYINEIEIPDESIDVDKLYQSKTMAK